MQEIEIQTEDGPRTRQADVRASGLAIHSETPDPWTMSISEDDGEWTIRYPMRVAITHVASGRRLGRAIDADAAAAMCLILEGGHVNWHLSGEDLMQRHKQAAGALVAEAEAYHTREIRRRASLARSTRTVSLM